MSDTEPYDPSWIVALAVEREPDDLALHEALRECTQPVLRHQAYVYFVSPSNPNEPGSEWQFDRNVVFEDTPFGLVVVDMLKDGRIGGIEFVDSILKSRA